MFTFSFHQSIYKWQDHLQSWILILLEKSYTVNISNKKKKMFSKTAWNTNFYLSLKQNLLH